MCAGIFLLQIHLSKKEGKLAGLVLPAISFMLSLVITFAMTSYSLSPSLDMQVLDEAGHVISTEAVTPPDDNQTTSATFFTVLSIFFTNNISTIILLLIYFACREKQRRRKALDKMQVLDLE